MEKRYRCRSVEELDTIARDILESIIGSVDRFREGLEYQDDITLVVIKVTG